MLLGTRINVTSFLITYYWIRFFCCFQFKENNERNCHCSLLFPDEEWFYHFHVGRFARYFYIHFLFLFFFNNRHIFLWQSLHVIMTLYDAFLEPKVKLWRVSCCAGAMTWILLLWSFWNVIQKTSCNNSTTLWLLNQKGKHI